MPSVAIVTDTDSSLPASLTTHYRIQQVPITVHFGEETFTTGVDIDDKALFERIDRLGRLPSTSAPSPKAFASAYQAAFEEGSSSIVCICVSSKISATYNAALTACEEFPGKNITVIDSLSVSMGQGFMALAAAEAAQAGASHEEVVARVHSVGRRAHLFASLATVKYLAMSGRVGRIAAGMANMLNIRPILTIREGKLEMLERVRTRKVAMERLVELVQEAVKGESIERAAILHVNNQLDAAQFEAKLRFHQPLPESLITVEFTPGLSVHTGDGTIGIVVVTAERSGI